MAATEINRQQFEELLKGDQPVLVDYWAPWCGYCRRIAPVFERIAGEYGDRMSVVKIDIDKEPQLADEQMIEVIPTLVLYKGGKAAGSVTAPDSKAAIDRFLAETLGE